MRSWSRVVTHLETCVRGTWLGAQCLTFAMVLHGYGSAPCSTARYVYTWVDSLAIGFLRVVTAPLSWVPDSLYNLPSWITDPLYSMLPRLAGDIEAAAILAGNYYLGAVPLALVSFLLRWMTSRSALEQRIPPQ